MFASNENARNDNTVLQMGTVSTSAAVPG